MRYQKNGKDTWGYLKIFGRDDMRLQLVEVGGGVSIFVIPPPAAQPEKIVLISPHTPTVKTCSISWAVSNRARSCSDTAMSPHGNGLKNRSIPAIPESR